MKESNAIAEEIQDFMKHYNNFVERLDNMVKKYISSDYEGRCGNCYEFGRFKTAGMENFRCR